MFGLHENEYPSKQVFVQDVVLDVVGVVFDEEREKFEDQTLQLYRAVVILLWSIAGCVGQKRTWSKKIDKKQITFCLITLVCPRLVLLSMTKAATIEKLSGQNLVEAFNAQIPCV